MKTVMPMECILRTRPDTKSFLDCRIVYSQRKTLQLEVLPDMSVRMLAPMGTKIKICSWMLLKRMDWVRAQMQYFSQFHPLTKPREYASGETHLFLGRRLRLKVVSGPIKNVKAARGRLIVYTGGSTSARLVKAILWQWYRAQAAQIFKERLLGCVEKLGIPEAECPEGLSIRRYKSRWASISPAGVLGLNLDLIRAPVECIDYIIIQELCRLRYPGGSSRMWDALERAMPDWRKRKARLERLTV
jgi:predicted metal-dependent hydrolase